MNRAVTTARTTLPLVSVAAAALLASAGCVASDPSAEQDQAAGVTQYLHIADFAGIDQGAWFDLRSKLNGAFADVCGDTFCEGDYANLTPLTFDCSVTSKLGTVHDCAWTFAGSLAAVDPTSSVISVDAPTFECHVHPKTTAPKLLALLAAAADPLHQALPGTTASLYDALGDCFQHPIGHTPVTFTTSPSPTYVDATAYYTSAAGQARWQAAKAALKLGFDNICGDTFCGSDFGDLQSLDLVCSVTRSTGNVKDCAWSFAGSYSVTATNGALVETSKPFRCGLPVKGTLAQLIATVTATGTEDALHRVLPGQTAVAYDLLAQSGCLP
jgi:hypothetical protein